MKDVATLISSVLSHPSAQGKTSEELGTDIANILHNHRVLASKEPEYNTATVNEPGHYFQILKRPTDELPQRDIVSQPCSQKVFYSAMDAGMRGFVGEDLIEAAFYLKWLNGDVPERLEYGAPEYVELMEITND